MSTAHSDTHFDQCVDFAIKRTGNKLFRRAGMEAGNVLSQIRN